jgi:23S rRNA pseudouridine2457 synthase
LKKPFMSVLLRFNKPFQVLSQFRREADSSRPTLGDFFTDPTLRLVGRLDFDSEGLLLLTDNGRWLHRLANPRFHCQKCYWAQVEGAADERLTEKLCLGVTLNDGLARADVAEILSQAPPIWPRQPPIRFRQHLPTTWLSLCIHEGRNRQIRRMTAACGFPTLRLIRYQVGPWLLTPLLPGEFSEISDANQYFRTQMFTAKPLPRGRLGAQSLAKPKRRLDSSEFPRRK